MCITGEKTKQNATEKKSTSCHATVHTTGSGARNEDMNFCVNMVKCTVCMSVYDYICCHYMRGGYHVLLVKTFVALPLLRILGFEVLIVKTRKAKHMSRKKIAHSISIISDLRKQLMLIDKAPKYCMKARRKWLSLHIKKP